MTDLDPESQRLLELARAARTPLERDKLRVAERLGAVLGAATLAGAAAAASTARAEASTAVVNSASGVVPLKWLTGSALLAAVIAGYVVLRPAPPPPVAPSPHVALQPPAIAAPVPPASSSVTLAPAAQPTASVQDRVREHVAHRVEHRAAPAVDTLPDEIELLQRAQAAWRARDARGALGLLDEHRGRYPHSQLELERDALQALVLCQLGRSDEARRIARNVLARAPQSPLRASLEQSCALK